MPGWHDSRMWLAGISWDADGWDLDVLDAAGQQAMPPRRYGAAERDSLLAQVIELSGLVRSWPWSWTAPTA